MDDTMIPPNIPIHSPGIWPPGELHETGQEEVQTVDWLGLNQRLGKKDADSKPQEVRSGLVG